MKKSKKIVLTLLSAIALATVGCEEEKPHKPNPYDEYSYAGKSGDEGGMSMHYSNGLLTYFLVSRMFDGYGYNWNSPYYRNMRGGGAFGYVPRVYSGSASSGRGIVGAHSSIGRGGFGGTGMSHGVGA